MKVANTRKINEHITEYKEREIMTELITMTLAAPIETDQMTFNESMVSITAQHFKKAMAEDGVDYTDDEAAMAMMITTVANEVLQTPDGNAPLPATILHDITKSSRIFHKGYFDNNAYFKNIHFDNYKLGNFELSHDSFKKYELIMYSTAVCRHDGIPIPRIGTFDHRFKYPCIKENGSTWMSVTPNEIFTMEDSIKNATGNVLTLGCGMGYWTYMVSEKDDVNHVTVIEKAPEVIELFNTFILPQFAHKDKITVIQADAFEYMENLNDGVYDYCFADIWKGSTDIIPYIKLKGICERKFRKTKNSYWIEDALIFSIITVVYAIIYKNYCENQGALIPINKTPGYIFLEKLLENEEITSAGDVDYYMDFKNILALIIEKSPFVLSELRS